MTHSLVTFLGKGRDDPQTGYRKASYCFPDGTERETAYFGLVLTQHLAPDRLVVLGTRGSMWGVFVEQLATADEEDLRLELYDAEASATVSQNLLDRLTPLLRRSTGREVIPRLIPYGRTEEEQRQILGAIDEAVPRGEVSFDVTHAFRHLGMLGLISAFMLERVGRLQVKGLWYGALDMTEAGRTPVVRLDGLLAIQHWVDALDRYDATGDYGVFAPLLAADGMPQDKARCLEDAAFHERTFNVRDARRKLLNFLPALEEPLAGASGLFQKKLRDRLDWARDNDLHEQQRRLAYVYLRRRDFVRAAVFAWEALISRACADHGLDPDDYGENGGRDKAEALMRSSLMQQGMRWGESAHFRLKNLRNALAHGSPPVVPALRQVVTDPDRLYKTLEADLKRTLG